jgi:hypothetical protein
MKQNTPKDLISGSSGERLSFRFFIFPRWFFKCTDNVNHSPFNCRLLIELLYSSEERVVLCGLTDYV